MPIVNVKDFGSVKFPDDMSPDDIKSVLDKKYAKPAPLRGALAGVEEFAGSIPKGLASISEGATPVAVPAPIWTDDPRVGTGPISLDSGGRAVFPQTPNGPEVQRFRPRNGPEIMEGLKNNALYKIGQTAAESVPLTDQQRASKITQGAEMVGGSAGMALGPLAIPAFTASAMGDTANDYERIKQENPKISDDEAADRALQLSVNKGVITAATFSVLPPAIRGALEKHLVGKLGNRWLEGRLASATEAGAVMGAQAAGQEASEGKAPGTESAKATGGGAIMGLLLPWLRSAKGGEINARSQQKTAEVHGDVRPQPEVGTGKVPAEEGGRGVQPPSEAQAEVLLEPSTPSPKSKAVTYKLEQDEGGGYSITAPDGSTTSTHDSFADAKIAMDKLKVSGGRTETANASSTESIQSPAIKTLSDKVALPDDKFGNYNKTSLEAGMKMKSVADLNAALELYNSIGKKSMTDIFRKSMIREAIEAATDSGSWQEKHGSIKHGERPLDFKKNPEVAKWLFENRAKYTGDMDREDNVEHQAEIKAASEKISGVENQAAIPQPNEPSRPQKLVSEVKLSPEDQAHIDAERGAVGVPVEIVDQASGDNPFAKNVKGVIATIDRGTGKILINKDEFSSWLKDIAPGDRRMAVRSLLGEERIHLATDNAAADAFWKNLTAAEKAIVKRRYSGGNEIPGMNDTLWGHEALRFRMQQLARMTPREIVDAVGKEKWTLKALTLVETAIRGIREKFLRTGASQESLAILSKIQESLNMGKVVASGSSPSAMSKRAQQLAFKQADELEQDAMLFEKHGDKEGAEEMRQMAKNLRQKTFDESFKEPAARPKKRAESKEQERFLLPGSESIGTKPVFDTEKKQVSSAPVVSTQGEELPAVPEAERKTAEQSGALPRLTSTQIDERAAAKVGAAVQERIEASKQGQRMALPSFKQFASKSTGQHGRLLEIWQSAVGKLLENMPGEDMRLLAKAGIQGKTLEILSDKEIEEKFKGAKDAAEKIKSAKDRRDRSLTKEAGSGRSIWDAPVPDKDEGIEVVKKYTALERDLDQKMLDLAERESEVKELASDLKASTEILGDRAQQEANLAVARTAVWDARKETQDARRRIAELKPEYDGVIQKRKRRGWIQSALFRKMVRPALEENQTMLARKDVTPEEIRYGGGGKYSAYEDTTRLPESKVAEALTDNARRSRDDAATITRRLAVLLNPRTGSVHMVSAYDRPHGREVPNDVYVLDPISPMKEHIPLSRIMSRYKVLRSVLLDEPVRKFRQDFKNIAAYESDFGKDVNRTEQQHSEYQPGSLSEDEFMAETGGRISGGSGGSFQGPHRDTVFEDEAGAREKSETTPLTDAEGKALLDHVLSRGEPLSVDDVDQALSDLASVTNRQAMSAIAKLGNALQDKHPDSDGRQLKKMLAQFIFENHRASRKIGRSAPADIKKLDNPMAINRQRLREERDKIVGELATTKTRIATVFKRTDESKAMASSLDAADTVANNFAENAQWSVRLPSADEARNIAGVKKNFHGKKEILEGAPAMLSAGAVKARYNYSPEAMAEAERLMKEEGYGKKKSYLDHLKKDLAIKTNMGKDTPAMREAVKSMQTEFDTLIQRQLLESGFLNQADATYYHDLEAKSKLDEYMFRVRQGIEAADRMVKDGNYWDKYRGRRWKRGNEKLLETLEFAKAQWGNPELQDTALMMRKELDRQFELERNNGYDVRYDDNYLPGRYDGELFSQHGVLFGGTRILGRQFRAAAVFPTIYHAAENGPYVSATLDGSAMVGSRVRQGMRSVMRKTWWNGLKHINDDVTGKPIASAGKIPIGPNGKPVEGSGPVAPSKDYTHEFRAPGGDRVFILDGYESLVSSLTDPSAITKNVVTRGMLEAGQFLKHTVLMGDIFHLGRVTYYAASILGRRTAYLPGWAATSIREADIPRAVESGVISQETADFLNEKVAFRIGNKASMISRSRLSHLYQRSGLNVGKIQDAIYKDLVKGIPGLGQYNRFLFDRYTRGMMMTSALREFDRLSKVDPNRDSRDIIQDSARDLNFYFGNIGRQGWIRSATFQDISRLTLLAPQWLEGLIRKEMAPLRALTNTRKAFTGQDTMFRGIARGLLAMLALTQVINMITRGVPTWQNKEKDHKWDADVGENVWLSPLAVFNELTGDFIRMLETKQKAWDAVQQIGENKLGFYGRAAIVLSTDKAPGGKYQTTTAGVLGQAAKQIVPTPISFGVLGQEAIHKVAPGMVPPVTSQTMRQKVFSTTGLKTHAGMDAVQYTKLSAEKFRKAHNITAPEIQYTDEPSYSQLRFLVKNGDLAGAQKMLEEIKKTKTDKDVIDAMRIWVRKPFTGSLHSERLWLGGMDDEERSVYRDAVNQKMKEYQDFVDWYFHAP